MNAIARGLTRDLAHVVVFAALIVVMGVIAIPVGAAGVPLVLQNAVIILAGLTLGPRRSFLAVLLVLKVILGMAAGFVLDVPLRRVLPQSLYGGYAGHADEVDCHEEHEEHSGIFLAALRHTLEIFAFILLFSFLIGLVFELVGEGAITALLGRMGPFQPMVAALIGLVPNCAASVLLAQLYMQGAITFGSLMAGLTAGAGIGLAVLWRVNPSWKQNLFMTGLLWAAGAAVGIVLQFLPI